MRKLKAFTLIELLIVLAVVAIVSALLFPVYATAKASAIRVSCFARFRQVGQSVTMYASDYDDYTVPINHEPGQPPNATTDRTWVQLLLPYIGSFKTFRCPADYSVRPKVDASFDQDLLPGDLYARYYESSMRTNLGYNFQYLAPIIRVDGEWMAQPHPLGEIQDPSKMMLFIDSVWSVIDGVPVGGGSWLVSPPCRYEEVGGQEHDTIDPSPGSAGEGGRLGHEIFAPMVGWDISQQSAGAYGSAWPWHNGVATMCSVGGSVRPVTMQELAGGCDVRPQWEGQIYDRAKYVWQPR